MALHVRRAWPLGLEVLRDQPLLVGWFSDLLRIREVGESQVPLFMADDWPLLGTCVSLCRWAAADLDPACCGPIMQRKKVGFRHSSL